MSTKRRSSSKRAAIVDGIYTTDTGVKILLKPVPAMLLESAQSMIPEPPIPTFIDSNTGNEKENPTSEAYRHALGVYESQRSAMAVVAALVRGAVLVDDEGNEIDPPDSGWKETIGFFGADWRKPTPKGYQSISGVVELPEEWAEKVSYLMYEVLTANDMTAVLEYVVGGEEYEAAVKSFQSN